MLSHGGNIELKFPIKNGPVVRIRHLSKLHEHLRDITTDTVKIEDPQSRTVYHVQIKELWIFFKDHLENIFPFACEEALHMSAETVTYEPRGAYIFKSED